MKKLLIVLLLLALSLPTFAAEDRVVVVVKTGNLTVFDARAKQFGIVVRDSEHGTPFTKIEGKYEIVNTPILEDINGDLWFTVWMTPEQASKLPRNDTPNFSVPWEWPSEDCIEDGVAVKCPWPMVTGNTYDEFGVINGTTQQGVGRIQ